jgi:hypothetical protein
VKLIYRPIANAIDKPPQSNQCCGCTADEQLDRKPLPSTTEVSVIVRIANGLH